MSRGKATIASPLRGAVIGFGNVAVHGHLPVWQEYSQFRIDAVVEPLEERSRLARTLLPEARIYADSNALFEETDLDFVDICTPPCFHTDLIKRACLSGMHVFCEKPLVASANDLRSIHQTAHAQDRVIFIVNNWKYAPIWMKAADLIRENRIGSVRTVSLSVLRTPNSGGGISNWRQCAPIAGGGILLDHGWHNLYLILSVIRDIPVSISARMSYVQTDHTGLEDTVDLQIRFRNAEARLHLTWRAALRQNHGSITGEFGTLFINDDHLILHPDDETSPIRYDFEEPLSGGSHHRQWMGPVVENFYREVTDSHERGINFSEAVWCACLTDLAYRSHRNGACFLRIEDPLQS